MILKNLSNVRKTSINHTKPMKNQLQNLQIIIFQVEIGVKNLLTRTSLTRQPRESLHLILNRFIEIKNILKTMNFKNLTIIKRTKEILRNSHRK